VFFLKTLLYLIKRLDITNLTSNYAVPEYRVQFCVNFAKFGLEVFCGEQANVFEILHQFFNLLKRGSNFKKLVIVRCFILDRTFFLKFLCISEEKKLGERKKKYLEAML